MATDKQIAANRENSQHSTGPATAAGKAAASRNATRHGLCARGFIVLPGQEQAFVDLEEQYRLSLQPLGSPQETLFMRILESAWNLHRCRLAESALYLNSPDSTIDPLLDNQNEAKYTRIQKYAKQAENSLLKMTRQLAEMQTEWHFRNQVHTLTKEELDDDELLRDTPQGVSEACSIREVMATLKRTDFSIDKRIQKRASLAFLEAFTAPPDISHLRRAEPAEAVAEPAAAAA